MSAVTRKKKMCRVRFSQRDVVRLEVAARRVGRSSGEFAGEALAEKLAAWMDDARGLASLKTRGAL